MNEKFNKAHAADAMIRLLTKLYRQLPGWVSKIKLANVRIIALFGTKIW